MTPINPPPGLLFDWRDADDNHHGIEPVFTAEEIMARVEELAGGLHRWFKTEPVVEVMMNGAMMFASDLVRSMSARGMVMEMDFIHVHKDRKAKTATVAAASNRPVDGRDVLLIEDVFETGQSLAVARDHYLGLGANSVTTIALLDKSAGKPTAITPDFIGFECPAIFVIGYGMDIGFRYRELPFIGRLGQA